MTTTATRYFIQPMTGTTHTDKHCSLGTARYRLIESDDYADCERRLREGSAKSCKKCGPRV